MPPMRKLPPIKKPYQKWVYSYECTRCHKMPVPGDQVQSREMLTQKKIVFGTLGNYPRIKMTRTREWLCPDCLLSDEDYMSEPWPHRRKLSEVTDVHEYLMLTDPAYAQGDHSADDDPYDMPGR